MRDPTFNAHRPDRNTPTIYGLKDPRHGMYCYVGQAVDLDLRYRRHIAGQNHDGNFGKARWMEDMAKAGFRPEMVTLQECDTFDEANKAERDWIRRLKEEDHPILNVADGGAGVRSASKLRAARKRDWIELGYMVKCARDATLQSMCDLSGMLPRSSKEVRLFERALRLLDDAKNCLDGRLYAEYPEWKDFLRVFFGTPESHISNLGEQHAEADREARLETMTKADIQRIIDDVPELNDFGVGVYDDQKKTPEERTENLNAGKVDLLKSVDACNKLCKWMADVERVGSINERIGSSYHLKHIAEAEVGYVTNGAFITAAIFCGFRYRIEPGSPNVYFGMSGRSIKAIQKRIEERKNANRSTMATWPLTQRTAT